MPTVYRSRFSRSRGLRRVKPSLRWQGVSAGSGTLGPDASIQQILLSSGTPTSMTNPTVMRIRGELFVALTGTISPAVSGALAFGIRVGEDQLANVATNPPVEDPWDDSFTNDWMYWKSIFLQSGAIANDERNSVGSVVRLEVDCKSRRKLDRTDALMAVFRNVGVLTTPQASFGAIFTGRVLLQARA